MLVGWEWREREGGMGNLPTLTESCLAQPVAMDTVRGSTLCVRKKESEREGEGGKTNRQASDRTSEEVREHQAAGQRVSERDRGSVRETERDSQSKRGIE